MAAGYKKCTVASSKVAATLSNYPTYVDLSRLGITDLAEAQSVRVYADESKTTEWAREIVSATEMHVKVPSLTTTTTIYVDWDGSRADYAVTDTYGRNAVWSAYTDVLHMTGDPSSGSLPNSTGGTALTTPSFESADEVTGQLGKGLNIDGTSDGQPGNTTTSFTSTFSIQWWIKPDVVRNYNMQIYAVNSWGSFMAHTSTDTASGSMYLGTSAANRFTPANTGGGIYQASTWTLIHYVWSGGTGYLYKNGSLVASKAQSTPGAWGGIKISSTNSSDTFNGILDELRTVGSQLSANWITTEYNNQSDEAGFWGTWTDAGGGTPAKRGGILLAW